MSSWLYPLSNDDDVMIKYKITTHSSQLRDWTVDYFVMKSHHQEIRVPVNEISEQEKKKRKSLWTDEKEAERNRLDLAWWGEWKEQIKAKQITFGTKWMNRVRVNQGNEGNEWRMNLVDVHFWQIHISTSKMDRHSIYKLNWMNGGTKEWTNGWRKNTYEPHEVTPLNLNAKFILTWINWLMVNWE